MTAIPLMVIDMQFGFLHHNMHRFQVVIEKLLWQIRLAMRRKAPIIFVEYEGWGETSYKILDLVCDYDPIYFVTKSDSSVSEFLTSDVVDIIARTQKLRVCGIYTNACVKSSVLDLLDDFPKLNIEIVKNACGDPHGNNINGKFDWANKVSGSRLQVI